MTERPILFNSAMVRALLAGTKTQTRRIVKPARDRDMGCELAPCELAGEINAGNYRNSHYGQPGERLWVRESFWGCDAPGYGDQPCVVYDDEWHGKEYRPAEIRPWARKFGRIPSIHMPRDCSRITLEIVDVRVERLRSISREDCAAEGIDFEGADYAQGEHYEIAGGVPAERWAFSALWERVNGAGSWDANPWVWVVEFKRVRP